MGTRETAVLRGRRRGQQVLARALAELRAARMTANVSQRAVAHLVGWSHTEYWRFENGLARATSVLDIAVVASVLGLELSLGLHPVGQPLRDKGHQALIARFRAVLSAAFRVVAEAPLPNPGDRRAWDLLLRLPQQLIGVEVETRLRDIQAFVRRVRQREAEGGADLIVIVLAKSAVNRLLLAQLHEALGSEYVTSPRAILRALRSGQRLPGSGVVLI